MTTDAAVQPWYLLWSQVGFYLTPAIIFMVTGGFAAWRYRVFRTAKPSIRIDLEVSSRDSSAGYNVLSALAVVTNTSRVMADCSTLQWEVRVLAPFSDEDVESKLENYLPHMERTGPPVEFPWNVQHRITNENPGIALEPGESNVVDMSLPLPEWIEAVDVRCTMVLPKGRRGPNYVWNDRKVHDMPRRTEHG